MGFEEGAVGFTLDGFETPVALEAVPMPPPYFSLTGLVNLDETVGTFTPTEGLGIDETAAPNLDPTAAGAGFGLLREAEISFFL